MLDVAGRVVRVSSEGFRISDAFAVVDVRGQLDVDVGDLLVVSVQKESGEAQLVALVQRHLSAVDSRAETTRFVDEGVGANLLARAQVFSLIRSYFARERFIEVETPELVPSPGLDLHLDAVEASEGGYLITSPEYQMKRLLVGRLAAHLPARARASVAGETGARHNPEFTMLEWYRAFAGIDEVMRDTEQLVAASRARSIRAAHSRASTGRVDVAPPFERIPVAEAFARFAGVAATRRSRWPTTTKSVLPPAGRRGRAGARGSTDARSSSSTIPISRRRSRAPAERSARVRALRALRRRRRAVQRLRRADRSRSSSARGSSRDQEARGARRQAGLPDRRAIPRRARRGHAAVRGQRARESIGSSLFARASAR